MQRIRSETSPTLSPGERLLSIIQPFVEGTFSEKKHTQIVFESQGLTLQIDLADLATSDIMITEKEIFINGSRFYLSTLVIKLVQQVIVG